MSIPEQIGKVANSVVDSLKTNPSCLAALAVVALFGVLNYFEAERQNERMMARTQDVTNLLNKCLDANRDITHSVIPGLTEKEK
jgi:hypothetical protein